MCCTALCTRHQYNVLVECTQNSSASLIRWNNISVLPVLHMLHRSFTPPNFFLSSPSRREGTTAICSNHRISIPSYLGNTQVHLIWLFPIHWWSFYFFLYSVIFLFIHRKSLLWCVYFNAQLSLWAIWLGTRGAVALISQSEGFVPLKLCSWLMWTNNYKH